MLMLKTSMLSTLKNLSFASTNLWRDTSLSSFTAGFVAVLVGFTSSVAIVFQAATVLDATPAQLASWMWALGLGMGLCSLVPSLLLKKPIMVAWSTPGAAVLAVAGSGFDMPQAVAAFMASAVLTLLLGITGWFEKLMKRIPVAIASALLAGVLTRFGLEAFIALKTQPFLVLMMLISYLLARRLLPRYAVPVVLLTGITVAFFSGQLRAPHLAFELTSPVWVTPHFTWKALVSLAVPLFIVTMASQNLPGVAALEAANYRVPISKIISLTGVATLVLAPWGAFALSLSAITASICMGPQAHADPERRYTAAVWCGVIYCIIGLFGAAVTGVLAVFPKELISAIAGLALLGSIGGGLAVALKQESDREAALITFLVALSGVSLWGVGSAFWAVVAGTLALVISHWGRPSPVD